MSIYENPTALTKPEYKYLFDIARDNRRDIVRVLFDKDNICRFNADYGMLSERNLDFVLNAFDEIQGDEAYTDLCCILYVFIKNGVNPADIRPAESKTIKSEFALMLPFFACVSEFCNDAIKRGVDKEILSTTLKAVVMYISTSEKRLGIPGTSIYHGWLTRYAMGRIFRIGQFQMIAVSIFIVLLCRPIATLYNPSAETLKLAVWCAIWHSINVCLTWPMSFALPNILRAANDVKFTMTTSIVSMWTCRIAASYLLALGMGLGLKGVWIAMTLDWMVRAACFGWRFLSGKWEKKQLLS